MIFNGIWEKRVAARLDAATYAALVALGQKVQVKFLTRRLDRAGEVGGEVGIHNCMHVATD